MPCGPVRVPELLACAEFSAGCAGEAEGGGEEDSPGVGGETEGGAGAGGGHVSLLQGKRAAHRNVWCDCYEIF